MSIIGSAGGMVEWYRIRNHSENAKTDTIGLHNYRLLAVMHSDSLLKMAFYGKLFSMWKVNRLYLRTDYNIGGRE